ncbi:hypothetical protein POM88_033133 [Heracleum sosnowskyi]|uniref:Uncharacterized protein n=1 Tax=Heracleum sosnowskyi TaxID=360622 RepID=A0AAD8I1I5_9APIA|nr:hypothetical protein POM88_033133 [Heracleum sosnowskyi]
MLNTRSQFLLKQSCLKIPKFTTCWESRRAVAALLLSFNYFVNVLIKKEESLRKDRNDKDKHNNRIKRELSANSLIEILRRRSVETDEQKEQYKQLVRLFVIDQIFLPSTENAYIRSGNYKYCSDGSTFESINWAQAILDRIYVAFTKNTRTFSACGTVFQALIYDKIPSLVPKDMKPKSTLVAADKYPVVRKKKESWKLELDKLNSKDVRTDDGSEWALIEALSMKDAFRFRYKEQQTHIAPNTINVDSQNLEKTEQNPETVEHPINEQIQETAEHTKNIVESGLPLGTVDPQIQEKPAHHQIPEEPARRYPSRDRNK